MASCYAGAAGGDEGLDTTRGRMMAMTMVGGDHFFLSRWVEYYGRQLGRENLFVLSHGGTIAVESEAGHGACFTIDLPYGGTN